MTTALKRQENQLIDFPHLTSIVKQDHDEITISNLLTELQRRFPDTNFTIHKYDKSSIGVRWLNGVSGFKVGEVKNMFTKEIGKITPFISQYGGLDEIYLERDMSDDIRELVYEFENHQGMDDIEYMDILFRIWWRIDIPADAKSFRLTKIRENDSIEFMYTIEFDNKLKA